MRFVVIGFASWLTQGCVDQGSGPPPKKIDPVYVQSHLLAAPPQDIERFDVPIGDVAVYLGNKLKTEPYARVAPGQAVTITHYWKVLKTPASTWNVFAIVRGPAGTADFMNLLPTDMELAHAPGTWEPGEIIEDVQTFTVRPDWRAPQATVFVGLIERGSHGTLDRMAATGPKTQDRAIVARQLEIDLSRAPPPKGTAYVPRAPGAIAIDGVAADPGWVGAVQTELTTAEGGADPIGKAVAKMTWDDQALYVFVAITDSDIVSPFKQHDDPLWKADCVELFIDADGNRRGYVELQASPLGVRFDSWFAETRAKPGDEAWDSGMVAGVKLRGSAEAGDSGDTGWDVELAIPWAAVKGRNDAMAVRLPPQVGDRWRLNVVRVDRKTGGAAQEVFASSWNRITTGDFHALDRMLTVVFADSSGAIVPQAVVPAGGAIDVQMIARPDAQQPSLVLDVVAGGAKIAGTLVADGEIAATIQHDQTMQLVVRAEPGIAHARVVSVIDRAAQAGFTRFAFEVGASRTSDSGSAGSGSATRFGLSMATIATKPVELAVAIAGVRVGETTKPLGDSELDTALRAAYARNASAQLVIRGLEGVSHARILVVIENARRIGFERFAIAR